MESLRSKIAANQTALASLGAGILLCTLAAFVYVATADNRSGPDGSRSATTMVDRGGWRASLPDSAMHRVSAIESWRVVLDWALGAEEGLPGLSSANIGQAEHLSNADSEPPRLSGRSETRSKPQGPVKRGADAAERLPDKSPSLSTDSSADSEE